MSVRTRIFLASLLVALLPFALIAFGLRRETAAHIAELDQANLETLTRAIELGVARSELTLARRLSAIRESALDDNDFRLALLDPSRRADLVDYMPRTMALTGLSLLQLQDEAGLILSSGHFRNDYGRVDATLPGLLKDRVDPVLVEYRTPAESRLALTKELALEVGGRRYSLIGGISPEAIPWLDGGAQIGHLQVNLLPAGTASGKEDPREDEPSGVLVGEIPLPFLADGARETQGAAIEIRRVGDPASEAVRALDRWFGGFLVLAALGAGALGLVASAWISRPLRDLAEKTTRVHLQRFRVRFESDRHDEVGELTRFVGGMVERLQDAAAQLQDAERRATLGELARQINHDVKNGVTPIRNVLRHLAELEQSDPASIARVFSERRSTLESSLAYLEELASNYGRLSPRLEHRSVDLNDTLRQVGEALLAPPGVQIRFQLAPNLPTVSVDPLGMRRIVENLARNAVEAVAKSGGTVTIASMEVAPSRASREEADRQVRIAVSDTGSGLSAEESTRIFQHFYTTKPTGTGLGLSIVKRLVADFGGNLAVQSEPGQGSTFLVTLPVQKLDRSRTDPLEAR